MNRLLLLFALSFVGAWALDEELLFSLPDPSWARRVDKENKTVKDDDQCTSLYSCPTCKTARVCKPTSDNGIFEVVATMECPKDRPFCNPETGTCDENIPNSCGGDDKDFICMQNGRFPDPDCTKFHVCIDYKPTLYQCIIEKQNYNPKTMRCEDNAPCGTFTCGSSNQVSKSSHSTVNRFFAYCNAEGANGPLVIDACPVGFKMEEGMQKCVPNCEAEGIIADPQDCHFYYQCTQVTYAKGLSVMTNTRKRCPEGQAYSVKDFLCVDEKTVESCENTKRKLR